MFVHQRLLQPHLEKNFSQPRFLRLAFESNLYIIISVFSNAPPPSSSLLQRTWPLPRSRDAATPRFSSSNIPPHLTPLPACNLLHSSVPERSLPARTTRSAARLRRGSLGQFPPSGTRPLLPLPRSRGASADSEPRALFRSGSAPGAAPPARAGAGRGWPRPRLPLVPARLRARAKPAGSRHRPPGSFAPPAVPQRAAGTASLPSASPASILARPSRSPR